MAAETVSCPTCAEVVPAGGAWCEACGADLEATPAAVCVACGRAGIDDDGYCTSCGHKQPGDRDRVEITAGRAVAVTDRGLRHHHNEDAVAVAELPDGVVLVVCDGVSSTAGSAEASKAAADAAVATLVDTIGPEADAETIGVALQQATAAAQDAATAMAGSVTDSERAAAIQDGPPSSTFVAAVALERKPDLLIGVAWLGDSRAYWVDGDGAARLTTDHELHGSLIRWIGADSGRVPPDVMVHTAAGGGRLLLCSDGFWRYADPVSELDVLLGRLHDEGVVDDVELARRLTAHAIDSGGHDNISVALWSRWASPVVPEPSAAEGEHSEERSEQQQ